MFLCAVARPRYKLNTHSLFNRKIGIWQFVPGKEAKRNSKLLSVGMLETKPIVLNCELCTSYLLEKGFHGISSKFSVQRCMFFVCNNITLYCTFVLTTLIL